ncbi:tetratricopeptide repeat protein [Streptomyces sp. NPDC096339]|uniref:tetratricopeptide repeat protein n=1 Tax=Streptomyces sp. NPDC096339 TaxID=3366086 RepID=UPI00382D4BD4
MPPEGLADSLFVRYLSAHGRGRAGDPPGAADAAELLVDTVRVLGTDHRSSLLARQGVALWRGEAGDAAGAVAASAEFLEHRLRVLGPDHPDTLSALDYLAHWRGQAGDATGAAQAYQQLFNARLRLLGPDHPDTLTALNNLTHWCSEARDAAAAAQAYEQLLLTRRRITGDDHPQTLAAWGSYAHWRGESGDAAGAAITTGDSSSTWCGFWAKTTRTHRSSGTTGPLAKPGKRGGPGRRCRVSATLMALRAVRGSMVSPSLFFNVSTRLLHQDT